MPDKPDSRRSYTTTRNACKLCSPLGACAVFKGIAGAMPIIHGSQGCATYIRRYMISHYKEPLDIASSNFSEASTIYGGNKNFLEGIDNIRRQYSPKVVGIASTCLAETIGEDIPALIAEYKMNHAGEADLPLFIHAATPSYQGSHMDGFHEAVSAAVKALAVHSPKRDKRVNLFAGFISPADLRHLKDFVSAFGLEYTLLPDYSETLDNPFWKDYLLIPTGGTPVDDIRLTPAARTSIELGNVMNQGALNGRVRVKSSASAVTAGEFLESVFGVPNRRITMPIGIDATDRLVEILKEVSGAELPERYALERGRLVDAYIDCHKYVFGKRALVYGEEDFVIGMVSFLKEIGMKCAIAASGGESGAFKREVAALLGDEAKESHILEGGDFETMREIAHEVKPDVVIGHSKGYYIARELGVPIVRVGFPIHDRVGGPRMQHLCYAGTQQTFDRIVNALLDHTQEHSPVGYKYM